MAKERKLRKKYRLLCSKQNHTNNLPIKKNEATKLPKSAASEVTNKNNTKAADEIEQKPVTFGKTVINKVQKQTNCNGKKTKHRVTTKARHQVLVDDLARFKTILQNKKYFENPQEMIMNNILKLLDNESKLNNAN